MALTGFDPAIVETSIRNFISAADDVMDCLCGKFKTNFVDKMGEIWACNDAQNYFRNSVKPAMDSLTSDVNKVFASVVNSMRSAGQKWANQTGSSITPIYYNSQRKLLDISAIKENKDGVRGIDFSLANTATGNLDIISNAAQSALERAVTAVQTCGFMGGTSEANLIASLNTIKTNISDSFSNCKSGLKSAITETVKNYQDTEGKIAQAFAGQE